MKTPGPWKVIKGQSCFLIRSVNNGYYIAKTITDELDDEANFEFIIRACNAHDDLLEACKEFVRKVECGEARSKRSYQQMKAAISKAERKED